MEQVRSSLEQTEKGKVSNAASNYKRVFQLDPLLKGAIRKNLLTERVDIVKPLGWYRDSPTLTDVDIKYLLLYFEENYGMTIEKKIQDAVMVIANENRYHPVRDFLNALQWDGIERIRYCLHRFLGADADDYTCEAMRLFLLGAISRAFRPGCKFEIMLCLVGGQGAGKSSFFRLLAVQDDWFSDDLKKLDDENVYRKMQGHWLIEMSEMIATANARALRKSNPFSAARRKPIKCHTKPTRLTENGSVCSAALPIRWIFCPLTAPATAVLCRSWYIQSWQKFTFWTMNRQQEPISYRSGQKRWRFTAAETSNSGSARQ